MRLELNKEQKNYIEERLQSFDNHRLDYGPDEIADIFLNECVDEKIVNEHGDYAWTPSGIDTSLTIK